jgi:hypothetical protein
MTRKVPRRLASLGLPKIFVGQKVETTGLRTRTVVDLDGKMSMAMYGFRRVLVEKRMVALTGTYKPRVVATSIFIQEELADE